MTNYREILRLHSLGLNKTKIAASLHCARNTVSTTLQRASNCGLQWPLPDEMSDKQLADLLFPSAPGKPAYKMPDYTQGSELVRNGLTFSGEAKAFCYRYDSRAFGDSKMSYGVCV